MQRTEQARGPVDELGDEVIVSGAFVDLMSRIRLGDEAAARELVKQYEPIVRREVRTALVDPRLSRLFDSIDVSQGVFASFFLRSRHGQFEVATAQQLTALLMAMARNKLASRSRDAKRMCRDLRRLDTEDDQALNRLQSREAPPEEQIEQKEILQCVRAQLTQQDSQIMDLRQQGVPWAEIARRLGGTAQSRRVSLMRSLRAAWDATILGK